MPNTQSKEVNLTKRIQTSKGARYCPVVVAANGRVKPDMIIINGEQERHPEGAITWSGVSTVDGCACRLAKTRRTQPSVSNASKQNSKP